MAKVQGSPEALAAMAQKIKSVISASNAAAAQLQNAYKSAGSEWNDNKYRELGEVVNQAVHAIRSPLTELEGAISKIKKMESDLRQYLSH